MIVCNKATVPGRPENASMASRFSRGAEATATMQRARATKMAARILIRWLVGGRGKRLVEEAEAF